MARASPKVCTQGDVQVVTVQEVKISNFRHELMEWSRAALPARRQGPERKDDRLVMNGVPWVLRTGAPWCGLPERYGPYATCCNRCNRWSKAGVLCCLYKRITTSEGRLRANWRSSAVCACKHRSDRAGHRSTATEMATLVLKKDNFYGD